MKSEFLMRLAIKANVIPTATAGRGDRLTEIMRMGEMPQAGYFVMAGDILEEGENYCIIMDYDQAYAWNLKTNKWDSVRYEGDLTRDHVFPNVAKAWQAVIDHKVPGE